MPWFNIDDKAWAHPKFIGLSATASDLWWRAGAWCAGHLTDGFVPDEAISLLGKRAAIVELVRRGLWERAEGGYQFHDWSDWQRTREQVEADRAAAKERQRKWRMKQGNRGPSTMPKQSPPARPSDQSVDEVLAFIDKRITKEET